MDTQAELRRWEQKNTLRFPTIRLNWKTVLRVEVCMENDVLINVIILSDVIEHVVNHVHLVRTVQTALVLVNAVYIADVTRQMAVVIV